MRLLILGPWILLALPRPATSNDEPPRPTPTALHRTVDLAVGESQSVEMSDGKTATVKLVGVEERRDPIRSAVREALVRVEVNGAAVALKSGNYELPVLAGGVQLDCPITGAIAPTATRTRGGSSRPPGSASGRPGRPGSSRRASSTLPVSAGSPR
jgi:hypothetical protein